MTRDQIFGDAAAHLSKLYLYLPTGFPLHVISEIHEIIYSSAYVELSLHLLLVLLIVPFFLGIAPTPPLCISWQYPLWLGRRLALIYSFQNLTSEVSNYDYVDSLIRLDFRKAANELESLISSSISVLFQVLNKGMSSKSNNETAFLTICCRV